MNNNKMRYTDRLVQRLKKTLPHDTITRINTYGGWDQYELFRISITLPISEKFDPFHFAYITAAMANCRYIKHDYSTSSDYSNPHDPEITTQHYTFTLYQL